MFGMGWPELALVAFVFLLLFGAKRVPEIAKSLGKAISAFKQGMKEGENESQNSLPHDKEKKD